MVINAGNKNVVVEANRRAKAETHIVETIANRIVVSCKLPVGLVEISPRDIAWSDSQRIQIGNIRWAEGKIAWLRGIGRYRSIQMSQTLNRIAGTIDRQVWIRGITLINDDAIAKRGTRYGAQGALFLPPARSFIIGEEKQAVLENRASERSAENIADQL